MAVEGFVDGAEQAVGPAQRINFRQFARRQDVELIAHEAAQALDLAELVHAILGPGHPQGARRMKAGRQASLLGQNIPVQTD